MKRRMKMMTLHILVPEDEEQLGPSPTGKAGELAERIRRAVGNKLGDREALIRQYHKAPIKTIDWPEQ